jgi:hypothetical protein
MRALNAEENKMELRDVNSEEAKAQESAGGVHRQAIF